MKLYNCKFISAKGRYIQYNILKQTTEKCSLRLKERVIFDVFLSQQGDMPPPAEAKLAKRQRLELVNKALSEYAAKSSTILENGEPSQSDFEAKPSSSLTNLYDVN